MAVVLTYGTFDLFHVGHVNLLRRARALGDRLVVGLSTDDFNRIKGKAAFHSYEDRKITLEACRFVDEVIPEENWAQKPHDILDHGVSIFAMGDDWAGKFDELKIHCQVVYLPRTPVISTTLIKDTLRGDIAAAGALTDSRLQTV